MTKKTKTNENKISLNQLNEIAEKLERAGKAKSSTVQYAKEKNLRKIQSKLKQYREENLPETLSKYWEERNNLIVEIAQEDGVQVGYNDNIMHIASRFSPEAKKKFSDKHDKLHTDEIKSFEKQWIKECDSPNIEIDLHKIQLSDVPKDYEDAHLIFDIIEE